MSNPFFFDHFFLQNNKDLVYRQQIYNQFKKRNNEKWLRMPTTISTARNTSVTTTKNLIYNVTTFRGNLNMILYLMVKSFNDSVMKYRFMTKILLFKEQHQPLLLQQKNFLNKTRTFNRMTTRTATMTTRPILRIIRTFSSILTIQDKK